MNIFYLDENPKLCAQYHVDRHVVKMMLESAQLLCTSLNVVAGEQVTPYKSTHVNHPCSIWVRESYRNWNYVYNLFFELQAEWQLRWKHTKIHKSVFALSNSEAPLNTAYLAELLLPNKGFTPPALAMPEHYRIPGNPVESYRRYYREEKVHLHKWTNREVPYWL